MIKKLKTIGSWTLIVIVAVLSCAFMCFVFKKLISLSFWWLGKIGLWFGTDNYFIQWLIANLLDIVAIIIVILLVAVVDIIVSIIKRR